MAFLMFLNLYLGMNSHAAEVAFLEIHDRNGRPVQLEPGGRFMHVAIRIGDKWLHAHSRAGVELFDDLDEVGNRALILRNRSVPEPTWIDYQHWLGKSFDFRYSWTRPDATYCSRLVADLLGVAPLPMEFAAEIWKDHVYREEALGTKGLSPDDLF